MGTAVLSFNRPEQGLAPLCDMDLTARDLEYVQLACEGLSNEQIAWRLRVTRQTVQSRFKVVYRKILVSSRTALAAKSARGGWFPPCHVSDKAEVFKPTQRRREVLAYLCEGYSNTEIAVHLNITKETVKSTLADMYTKLNIPGRTILARVAIQLGWVK